MEQQFTIEGSRINSIPDFYAEINRVCMTGEDWQLGNSLDAFNDLLYGGFGAFKGAASVTLIWKDMAHSREALGVDATRKYYADKLQPESPFNKEHFAQKLEALNSGAGQTYFDILIEIIEDHPNITLVSR